MKFELSTAKINSILARVSKGVGASKVMPITSYLKIALNETGLTITATDSVNFITYKDTEVTGEHGVAIVLADTLVKLASKTTKENMAFEVKESQLHVKGNGNYTIPLNVEDKFPEYEFTATSHSEVETKTLKRIFKVNEAAIATEMIMPCLTGFNVGNNVTTTDGVKMCINDMNVFPETRVLIPQPLAALLDALTGDKVKISKSGNKLLFSTDNIDVFGVELDGIDEFPDIAPLAEMTHENVAKIGRNQLVEVLDRMSIFVDKFDNYGVKLLFTADTLAVQDMKESSTELIEYKEGSEIKKITNVVVSIVYLQQLLNVMNKEVVSIHFEEGLPVKLSEEGIIQLLSTIDEIGEEGTQEEE